MGFREMVCTYRPRELPNEWLTKEDVIPSSPPKSLTQKAWKYNDGSGDVGNSPSQFLLVRGLDTMMLEETIAKGLEKLEVELKRILLIRDRNTNISWGFAFVEYQDASVSLPPNPCGT